MIGILEYTIIISFLIGAMAGATITFYYIGKKLNTEKDMDKINPSKNCHICNTPLDDHTELIRQDCHIISLTREVEKHH